VTYAVPVTEITHEKAEILVTPRTLQPEYEFVTTHQLAAMAYEAVFKAVFNTSPSRPLAVNLISLRITESKLIVAMFVVVSMTGSPLSSHAGCALTQAGLGGVKGVPLELQPCRIIGLAAVGVMTDALRDSPHV
jgi:hypothetical protein